MITIRTGTIVGMIAVMISEMTVVAMVWAQGLVLARMAVGARAAPGSQAGNTSLMPAAAACL